MRENNRQLFSSSMFISILPHIQLNQTFTGQKLCSFRFERRLWRKPYPSQVFPQTQVDSVVWYKMKCQRLVNRNQLLRILSGTLERWLYNRSSNFLHSPNLTSYFLMLSMIYMSYFCNIQPVSSKHYDMLPFCYVRLCLPNIFSYQYGVI